MGVINMSMRIGGLATGMDTNQIVDDLMRAERIPLDRLIQDRTRLEWQRDAYREINLKLMNFRDSFRATGLGLKSTFLQKLVTSSNESVVRATGSATALDGTVQMQVHQLATASTFVSTGVPNNFFVEGEDGELVQVEDIFSTRLGDLLNADGEKIFEFDTEGNAKLQFEVKLPSGEYEKVTVQINQTEMVQDVIHKMSRAGLGFQMFIDESAANDAEKNVVLTMSETGAGAGIRFRADVEDGEFDPTNAIRFFETIGFTINEGEERVLDRGSGRDGQNARFSINGYETERTSNSFTINGITYNLTGVTNGETVTITTETDTEKIFEEIMSFVEQYNELVEAINGALREERYRDYPPLTDEQKKEMTEKEIELWEEKARSGLLRNDSTLSSALSQMRLALFSPVLNEAAGVIRDLAQIGLVTTRDYMDGGKIVLDTASREMPNGERMNGEERLRYYIENHGEELYHVFMGESEEYGEQGILRRIRATLDSAIDGITAKAGREGRTNHQFTLGRQLNSLEDRISNFERKLKQLEDRYWQQFTSLEKAMAKMNAQAEQMWSMLFPQG